VNLRHFASRPLSAGILFLGAVLLALTVIAPPAPANTARAASSEEEALLQLINEYRQANGLTTLAMSPTLYNAASWMSNDMASNDYFSHIDSLGRDPFQRMAAFGYNHNTWRGENLASGATSPQQALELWKASPSHNEVLLNPNFRVAGLAVAYSSTATYCCYWTADFGGYDDMLPPPPPPPANTEPAAPPPPPATAPVSQPPQGEANPPAPPPEPTPQSTPEATPASTLQPEPEPTPEPRFSPPAWQEIAAGLAGPLHRLMILDMGDSILTTISYLAQRYLAGISEGLGQDRQTPESSDEPLARWWGRKLCALLGARCHSF